MATKNIVPRANNEGKIGTDIKQWGEGNFIALKKNGVVVATTQDLQNKQDSSSNLTVFAGLVGKANRIPCFTGETTMTLTTLTDFSTTLLSSSDAATFRALLGVAKSTTTIGAGTGLTGGGDISTDRSLSIDFTRSNTWINAQTFAGNITVNGNATEMPNQVAANGARVMNRDLVRAEVLNFDTITLRDDFVGGGTTSGSIGQLGWIYTTTAGGTVTGYGSPYSTQSGKPINNAASLNIPTGVVSCLSWSYDGTSGIRYTLYPIGTTLKSRVAVSSTGVSVYFGMLVVGASGNPQNKALRRGIRYIPVAAAWASGTYAIGQEVAPTTANGYRYRCTTAGTTSATEPTWSNSGTFADGTAVWTFMGPQGNANWVGFTESAQTNDDVAALTTNLGVPVSVNTGYDLTVKIAASNTLEFYVNDVLCGTLTNPVAWAWCPFFQARNDTTGSCSLWIDLFALYLPSR